MPCTTLTQVGDPVAMPCTDCGHTNLLHPGVANPSLDACLICELKEQL